MTKIAASFKKDTRDYNGVEDMIADWLKDPTTDRYAVVRFRIKRVSDEIEDGGSKVATIRTVHIEPVDGDDEATLRTMLADRFKARTTRDDLPQDPLPFPTGPEYGDADADGAPAKATRKSAPKRAQRDEWLDKDAAGGA